MQSVIGLIIALVVLAVIFGALERVSPALKREGRPELRTDLIYWFFTPLVTRGIQQVAVVIAVAPILLLMGRSLQDGIGDGPGSTLPVALQVVLILAGGDLIGYWSHRIFHGRTLWKFHAIHHSSICVDWLASVRLHPVNDAVSKVMQAIPFVVLGFSPGVVAAYVPFLTFYALLLHANVSWSYGPFRYLIASPTFHRWHHSRSQAAWDKNFAGLLPIYDVLFGTFYMPDGVQPDDFGIPGDPVPANFLKQLVYPFRQTGQAAA